LIQQGITKEALIGQRADRFPREILTGWDAQQLERALYLFLQLFRDLRFSLNPRYELELTVSRLAWLSDYVSPKELKEAFDAGYQSCCEEYTWHFLKDGDFPPQEDKEYLFYLGAKHVHWFVESDTWACKKNNKYVVAWAEFQTPKGF